MWFSRWLRYRCRSMRPGRAKRASPKERTREPVADAAAPAEPGLGPDSLEPVLDEEILEPKSCIR